MFNSGFLQLVVSILLENIKIKYCKKNDRARLDSGASLQVVLDFLRVLSVESFQLLVELHVSLVDVICNKSEKKI